MVEILRKHQCCGRMPKLSIEDQLLARLEYHTYAHIAAGYAIAEGNIYRGIKWVEDTLIKHQRKENHEISSSRIFVEQAFQFVKGFRILSERYCNRRQRFALRSFLIAGICNFSLNFAWAYYILINEIAGAYFSLLFRNKSFIIQIYSIFPFP